MLTNATLIAWEQRAGANRYGQPARTDRSADLGGGVRCAGDPKRMTLTLGDRRVEIKFVVHLPATPDLAIAEGDRITVRLDAGTEISGEIVQAIGAPHPTLGHMTLTLA